MNICIVAIRPNKDMKRILGTSLEKANRAYITTESTLLAKSSAKITTGRHHNKTAYNILTLLKLNT